MSIKPKIISLAIFVGLIAAGTPAQAIYSSKISTKVNIIRQHMFEARQLNGTGSPRQGIQKLFNDETIAKLIEEENVARQAGQVTGLPGEFHQYRQLTKADVAKDVFNNFGGDFLLLLNRLNGKWVNSCLRDDILKLQDMRDTLQREALLSWLKRNKLSASILWNDYKDMLAVTELMKDYYTDPKKKSKATPLFFASGENDYYLQNCPQGGAWGEYGRAFDDLKRSWDTLSTVLLFKTWGPTAYGAQWGSIRAMAQARARVRASEWIRANQITFSLRGEEGGSPTSIRDLYRSEGIGAIFKAQWDIAKAIIGPITPFVEGNLWGALSDALDDCVYWEAAEDKFRACTSEEESKFEANPSSCLQCRNKYEDWTPFTLTQDIQFRFQEQARDLVQAHTSLQFNLEFSSLADSGTKDIIEVLGNINAEIRSASEQLGDEAGRGLQTLCRDVRSILEKQCPGKNTGTLPACQ